MKQRCNLQFLFLFAPRMRQIDAARRQRCGPDSRYRNPRASGVNSPITETTGPSWAQPVYDDNGNQTAGPHPGAETSKNSYVYDAWNRLVKVKNSSGSVIATYNYNALGWRVSKTLGPASSENGAVYNYYYNANWQILEVDKTPPSSPTYTYKQYVWSLRYIDAPVCRFRDTNADGTLNETLYYAEDANFNVTALVDTSGAVVERYSYSAYGQAQIYSANWTSRTSSSYDNDILFGGYRWDSESGLYYVRHRMYNPALGRWMQRDPMGYVDGLNLYAYASSNPITLLDAMGLCSCGGSSGNGWFSWFKNTVSRISEEFNSVGFSAVSNAESVGSVITSPKFRGAAEGLGIMAISGSATVLGALGEPESLGASTALIIGGGTTFGYGLTKFTTSITGHSGILNHYASTPQGLITQGIGRAAGLSKQNSLRVGALTDLTMPETPEGEEKFVNEIKKVLDINEKVDVGKKVVGGGQ